MLDRLKRIIATVTTMQSRTGPDPALIARVDIRHILSNEQGARQWLGTVIGMVTLQGGEQHLCSTGGHDDPPKPTCATLPFRFGGTADAPNPVLGTARHIAALGTFFDVIFVIIGLWMASDQLLEGAIAATPTSIANIYFGPEGSTFRTRIGRGLTGTSTTSRLPAAFIVAQERLILQNACAAHGIPCVIPLQ